MRELSEHRMLLCSKTYEGGSAYITLLSGVFLNMILILFVLFHILEGNEFFLFSVLSDVMKEGVAWPASACRQCHEEDLHHRVHPWSVPGLECHDLLVHH